MLAKLTSKNQLTLPKAAVEAVSGAVYFDVAIHGGQIVLTPVRLQRGDAVRAKLAELGLGQADVSAAIEWARSPQAAPAIAEPAPGRQKPASSRSSVRPGKPVRRK